MILPVSENQFSCHDPFRVGESAPDGLGLPPVEGRWPNCTKPSCRTPSEGMTELS
jgi:hypothetical protein